MKVFYKQGPHKGETCQLVNLNREEKLIEASNACCFSIELMWAE